MKKQYAQKVCNRIKIGTLKFFDEQELPTQNDIIFYGQEPNREKLKVKKVVAHPICRAIIHYESSRGIGACTLSHWWDKVQEDADRVGTIDE